MLISLLQVLPAQMVGLHLSHKETNNSNDNDYDYKNNPVSSPILQKEEPNDDVIVRESLIVDAP
jgi:hypothetical protein